MLLIPADKKNSFILPFGILLRDLIMPPKRKITKNSKTTKLDEDANKTKSSDNNKNKRKKSDKIKLEHNLDDSLSDSANEPDECNSSSNALLENLSLIKNDKRLGSEFFDQYCLDLSKKLLGKTLVRRIDDTIVRTKIVEVEAYLGGTDAASHSFNNKCTNRNRAMFMPAGTAYVYNIYGMYCCFNISSKEPGGGVLIRALEPIDDNIDVLKKNRKLLDKTSIKVHKDLTSGPSRLCQALNITKELFNEKNLCINNSLWVENDDNDSTNSLEIVAAKRINIDYAGEEACNKLYRFYLKDNKYVSIIDKNAVDVSLADASTTNSSNVTCTSAADDQAV